MSVAKQLVTVGMLLALLALPAGFASAGDVQGDGLVPCPSSPNCVSSLAADAAQRVEPLLYSGDETSARQRLLATLRSMKRAQVIRDTGEIIHAEFRSAVFGFVDDVTFRFGPAGQIHVRSASRTGYYDFGANRRRVETIRALFSTAAQSPH